MDQHGNMLAWSLPLMIVVGFACLLFPPLIIVVLLVIKLTGGK